MKIRTDFVTNSSSSSFILSFKDEDSIYDTLQSQFPKDIEEGWSAGVGYLNQLYDEIKDAKRLTKEDVKEIIEDEELWYWDISYSFDYMSCSKLHDFINSDMGKKMIEEKNEKYIREVYDSIGDNQVIVQVEHGDGGEGEDGVLENNILPYLECTAISFNHH